MALLEQATPPPRPHRQFQATPHAFKQKHGTTEPESRLRETQGTSLTVRFQVSVPQANNSVVPTTLWNCIPVQSFPQHGPRYPGNWAEFGPADVECRLAREQGGTRRATLANNSAQTQVHTSIIDRHASIKFICIFHTSINPSVVLSITKIYTNPDIAPLFVPAICGSI